MQKYSIILSITFVFFVGLWCGIMSVVYFEGLSGHYKLDVLLKIFGTFLMFGVACIAARINYNNLKWQKQSRVWEINKGILLELLPLLKTAISETEKALQNELNSMPPSGYEDEWEEPESIKVDWSFTPKLDDNLTKVKLIYQPFLSKKFIDSIDKFLEENSRINEEGWINGPDPMLYDDSILNYKILKDEAKQFCMKVAGIYDFHTKDLIGF
ncbi:hypothetical protein [Desulfovibrio sp. UCD-KL4C]|uniref:hypothetical protein n=1 Tax=Desulfovibrio sp. UCD-KL4C TaxID=2578120 RepID=UPI0025BDEEC6|nr:hypothetical protein [Desulfovibrio sp. UCD-KL4C]